MNSISIPYKLSTINSNKELANELLSFIKEQEFSKVAILTSRTPTQLLTNDLEIALFDHLDKLKTFQVVTPSISYVNQLSLSEFDILIGVGGGKVIDTAKYAAHLNNIPCISIPTSISNDGICSPVAVLKEKENRYKSIGASMPIAMFIPLHLIQKSHEESIVSGIGDLLSNLSAVEDWILAHKEKDEFIDDYAVMVSKNAALSVFLLIENYVLQRKLKEQFLNENLQLIIESLALSGIAMEIAGTSRPASGAEHLISHAIDELYGGVKPHGIQVAFAMLFTTFLRAELGYIPKRFVQELKVVLRFIGVPITLQSLGLTKEQLTEAIIYAPTTRVEKYTILNKVKLEKENINSLIDKLFSTMVSLTS